MKKKYFSLSNSFLEGNQKENWEKAKSQGYSGASMNAECSFEEVDDNSFNVVMSTPKENRNGYEIMQNFILTNFKKNNVLLDGHNSERVRDILGRVESARMKDNKLHGKLVFAVGCDEGLNAYYKAKNGFLNAVSITIMPLEFDDEGRITKSEVLELSCVPIPADPDTLIVRNKKEDEKVENCKHCEKHGCICMSCKKDITKDSPHFERAIGKNAVELVCEDCYKKDQEKENKVESKAENKESKKEQILRILKNKKKKDIEIKKEMLAVFSRLKDQENVVDTQDKRVKMANRLKKLTNKL